LYICPRFVVYDDLMSNYYAIMRKFLCIIALLCAFSGYAQNNITQVVKINQYAPSFKVWKGENHFRYVNFNRPSSYYTSDCLVAISPVDGDAKVYEYNRPSNNWTQIGCYESGEDIFLLYKFFDYEKKCNVFYRNIVAKDGEKPVWKPEQLLSIPKNEGVNFWERAVVSPDCKKAAVLMLATTGVKNNLRGSMAMLFDEDGLAWRTDVDMDFDESNIQILDVIVDNDGTIYAAILSYDKESKNALSETLHFCRIESYGLVEVANKVDFGHITGAKMLIRRDGTVAVGGYYADDIEKNEKGCFMSVYDNANVNVNFTHCDFPSSYYAYSFAGNGTSAEKFSVYPMEFFEFSNGTMAFLGDMQCFIGAPVTVTLSGNILVNFTDDKGNLVDFKTVEKNQSYFGNKTSPKGLRQSLFSYYALLEENNIHIFFSDNPKNYSGASGLMCDIQTTFFTSELKFKPHCAVHCVVGSDKQISTPSMLMQYSAVNTYLKEPLFVDGKELYFYHFQDKSYRISKINL